MVGQVCRSSGQNSLSLAANNLLGVETFVAFPQVLMLATTSHDTGRVRIRLGLIGILFLLALAFLLTVPRFPQDVNYHNFADQRTFLNVPHALAVDSKGNIYVGENFDGRRFQRFVYKGMGAPTGGTLPPPKP